jgi:hypothetical protein
MPKEVEGHTLSGPEREGALWAKALEYFVALTPGSNYYHPHNGTFRLTFTLRRPALLEGLARLEKTLGLEHWEEAGHGIEQEEVSMKRSYDQSAIAASEVEPTKSRQRLNEKHFDREVPEVAADLHYSDIVTASEIIKSRPCAC